MASKVVIGFGLRVCLLSKVVDFIVASNHSLRTLSWRYLWRSHCLLLILTHDLLSCHLGCIPDDLNLPLLGLNLQSEVHDVPRPRDIFHIALVKGYGCLVEV